MTGNGTSILAVDDDVMIRDLLTAILGNEGYEIHTAASGDEALSYLGRATPRLVISDVLMPDMDGFTLISRLRSESTSRSIPVLFLTSDMNPTDAETGLHLASGDFLRKPFTPEALLHEVESHLAADARTVEDMLAIKREPLTDVDTLLSTWRPTRAARRPGDTIAVLQVDERLVINARFGARGMDDLTARLVPVLRAHLGPDVAIGLGRDGTLACLIEGQSPELSAPNNSETSRGTSFTACMPCLATR